VIDPKRRMEHRRRLEAAGIDVVATRELIPQQFPVIATLASVGSRQIPSRPPSRP
jgi:hypothetical protein